ncbi:DUF2897 family protein [Marinobacter salicampi]|uniref:DUF2897 family protein n=1 Tax=Marinobacter salicampi TaxID=435907 RepID=UPI00140DAAE0|nr:DUF2897 family protein [Marinobacter salicampi]
MPAIGWLFLLFALALILGSLFMLRDSSNSMPISKKKMDKIRKRKAEVEADEKKENEDKW